MRRGRRCTVKAAPSQPNETLTARKRELFRTKTAAAKRLESSFWKSREGLTDGRRRPNRYFRVPQKRAKAVPLLSDSL